MMRGHVLHTKLQRNKQEETKSLKMNFTGRGRGGGLHRRHQPEVEKYSDIKGKCIDLTLLTLFTVFSLLSNISSLLTLCISYPSTFAMYTACPLMCMQFERMSVHASNYGVYLIIISMSSRQLICITQPLMHLCINLSSFLFLYLFVIQTNVFYKKKKHLERWQDNEGGGRRGRG